MGHAAKEDEGSVVTIAERLAGLRRIGSDKAAIRVGQVHRKEMHLALNPGDCKSLTEVHLGMAGVVGQWNKDLSAPNMDVEERLLPGLSKAGFD